MPQPRSAYDAIVVGAGPNGLAAAITLARAGRAALGGDAAAYWRLMAPIARDWEKIAYTTHGPLRFSPHLIALARFGLPALWPARGLAKVWFRGERARGLFAGLAAHSILPLERA